MKRMAKCVVCGGYTMKAAHCGKKPKMAHPPPYNPNDRYAKYRRAAGGIL
ncbi:MAG: nucleolar RNA-binding Nop10p family protein [Candidatus ainarchaeum sp.]|nr:nucleolar RNA-binding Nop10p family protein [Candidatus ainarchaeum sp.]MDD5096308.1 nucleolar RNA-binding Nop10p family protein [Candidatus ainarchaeum sp.]